MRTKEQNYERYIAASHAVQSAIAYDMVNGGRQTEPKHMRTGIDTTKADFGALTRLLIAKGVFTEEELWEALADGMEREVAEYHQRLKLPAHVRLA